MEEIQEKLNKSENVTTDNEALTQIAKVMDAVKKWLSEEGYKCNVDEDGDFTFKYQGKHVYFIKDNDTVGILSCKARNYCRLTVLAVKPAV